MIVIRTRLLKSTYSERVFGHSWDWVTNHHSSTHSSVQSSRVQPYLLKIILGPTVSEKVMTWWFFGGHCLLVLCLSCLVCHNKAVSTLHQIEVTQNGIESQCRLSITGQGKLISWTFLTHRDVIMLIRNCTMLLLLWWSLFRLADIWSYLLVLQFTNGSGTYIQHCRWSHNSSINLRSPAFSAIKAT